jgi:hypothetical protein
MNTILVLILAKTIHLNSLLNYIIGAIIAIFILGYLLFYLIRPYKF